MFDVFFWEDDWTIRLTLKYLQGLWKLLNQVIKTLIEIISTGAVDFHSLRQFKEYKCESAKHLTENCYKNPSLNGYLHLRKSNTCNYDFTLHRRDPYEK